MFVSKRKLARILFRRERHVPRFAHFESEHTGTELFMYEGKRQVTVKYTFMAEAEAFLQ